jgi:hypothetical protein
MYRSVSPSTGFSSGAYEGRYATSSQACCSASQAPIAMLWWAGRLSQIRMTGVLPPSSRPSAATIGISWSVS